MKEGSVEWSVGHLGQAWDSAVALTMPLCDRTMANCFVNASFSLARNGTCPDVIEQFVVGYGEHRTREWLFLAGLRCHTGGSCRSV